MLFRDDLKLDRIRALALAVLHPVATLHRKLLLTRNERPRRCMKLPIPAQPSDYLRTRMTHESSALACGNRAGKNCLAVFQLSYLRDSVKRSSFLSTAGRMLAQPSIKPLCAQKPNCFLIRSDVRIDLKLLHEVQMYVVPKCYVNYHLHCTTPKLDGRHSSNNVHYSPLLRDDTELSL